ncbi:hypothetical protein [Pseudomonas sp. RIT-PI-S]|uniref:ATP-grasp domain-containing protein n=1 Tax=Pseudomonas sp. RIT-PI-S TaxID=3035295 RepID=UPI0021DAD208|nr:hypothetical protein [Pseudomonas sp. RIT-PI-S]
MANNKLLILGIGNVALKYLEQALAPFGLEPVVMGDKRSRPGDTWATYSPARFHSVALERQAVSRYLNDHAQLREEICAVTTLFDELMPLVQALALEHGWDYPGPAAVRLSDKGTAATCAQALSPPSYPFTACNPDSLAEVLEHPGSDWVIKPACCSGGEAVGRIASGPGAVGRVRVHLARYFHINAEQWLMQPCLEGLLVSFEGFMQGGALHRMGVSRRSRIGLTEVANRFPAQGIAPEHLAQGWSGIEQLFSRGGYRDGWFHCECIVGPAGIHLIDTNAGRIGGATVLEQIALACGVLPAELLAHVLLLPLPGFCPRLSACCHDLTPTLGVWYGLAEQAVLTGIELGPHLARHTRFARDGAVVPPIGTSDYAWVGMFSGREADVLDGLRALRLHTDRGPALPAYSLD